MRRLAPFLPACLCLAAACAGASSEIPAETWRQRLRDAMMRSVETRAVRDEQSRLLADAVEHGKLDDLNRGQVRAMFGKGQACRIELCAEHGFTADDWYYEVGRDPGEDVKQLPVLIVGFDHRDRAFRVWTLTTH